MEIKELKSIIEAMLFAVGKEIPIKEFVKILEIEEIELEVVIQSMINEFQEQNRGIEIIKVNDAYQLCTKKEYYDYIYPLFDNRAKPNLSNPAMETLSIIAYNPKITKAEIESIRGVGSDGTIYKLLEYNLIEEAGKIDAPGRPNTYKTTEFFLKTFGLNSLEELPELPRYKLDENQQIVLEDLIKENNGLENEENDDVNVPEEDNKNEL